MLNAFTAVIAHGMLFLMDNSGRIVGWLLGTGVFMFITGAALI